MPTMPDRVSVWNLCTVDVRATGTVSIRGRNVRTSVHGLLMILHESWTGWHTEYSGNAAFCHPREDHAEVAPSVMPTMPDRVSVWNLCTVDVRATGTVSIRGRNVRTSVHGLLMILHESWTGWHTEYSGLCQNKIVSLMFSMVLIGVNVVFVGN
ncbi:uncharacterized protein DEA37_0001358 [Paragonimus westermani]|uniref:Uncharacterized protein n=1 Tax=Paragonimus westermani TaxID=34504 RepID=A0A5J4NI47_9TREM|nr:uncharacterized protein DEA37_0001358 [Paragonimus westermani]